MTEFAQDMTLKESVDALMSNLQNERKWRNVQTVLPESFGLVARVLTQQAQLIHKLEHRIEEMKRAQAAAASSDHAAALEERVYVVQKVEDLESKLMESETRKEAAVVPVIKEVAVATPEIPEKDVNAIREDLARVSLDVKDAEARIDYQIAALRQELVMTIGKKLCKSEVTKLLSRKMDAMDAWKQLAEKADSTRVEEVACTLMNSIQRHQESTMGDVERLRQLNESKANALELVQVKHNMIWKNDRPSAKQTIQWSSQVVNTNADIFLWQFGSDEVRLLLPGLYHLQAAFFTNYSPSIQVLVNGEPAILMRSPSDKKEVARSASYGVRRLHHSAGNVAGLSVEVFLALPARALVAISYDIDEKAQGFLNLRKL
ncbi:hypothetical protein JG688_00011009 [Phytophthora aleatoria]|uniref:C1q domain-containing protein n=1 Tax=Phytophthora aleatoria TaxID=2496075 RepID=A0A8J5J4U9_9STRA|nr:hypothetical protein JG688_00011009 [Phytophthora aleatoria]